MTAKGNQENGEKQKMSKEKGTRFGEFSESRKMSEENRKTKMKLRTYEAYVNPISAYEFRIRARGVGEARKLALERFKKKLKRRDVDISLERLQE